MAKRKIDGLTEDEFDKFVLILALRLKGWSYRKIGRVISADDKTVKSLYTKALQLKEDGKLTKNTNSERVINVDYVGSSQDLEEIECGLIDRQYGRRPTGHKIDD